MAKKTEKTEDLEKKVAELENDLKKKVAELETWQNSCIKLIEAVTSRPQPNPIYIPVPQPQPVYPPYVPYPYWPWQTTWISNTYSQSSDSISINPVPAYSVSFDSISIDYDGNGVQCIDQTNVRLNPSNMDFFPTPCQL